jgi:hypothetical protein
MGAGQRKWDEKDALQYSKILVEDFVNGRR